jgi:hypothetical protein
VRSLVFLQPARAFREILALVQTYHSTDEGLLGTQKLSDETVDMSTGGGHDCHKSWLIESEDNGYESG